MANSSIVRKAKNKIIKEFIKDPDIIAAINSSEVTEPQDLLYKHILPFLGIPGLDYLFRLLPHNGKTHFRLALGQTGIPVPPEKACKPGLVPH